MVTLFIVLLVVAVAGAIVFAASGYGPRVIRRTTVVDRPARRVVEEVQPERVTRRYVEE